MAVHETREIPSGKPLDIVPIHVIADSANKVEILNGLLRAEGLAVKPVWCEEIAAWQGSPGELVFYFADSQTHSLEAAIAHARRQEVSLIVVARARDAQASASAISAGAASSICVEDAKLLAAVARRERERARLAGRLRQLEDDSEHTRDLLQKELSRSQTAIATLRDGIIIEANAAWAERFGERDPRTLIGLPLMDFFPPASQGEFKRNMRAALKGHASRETQTLTLRRADGSEREATLSLAAIERDGEPALLARIAGDDSDHELIQRLVALEAQNNRLKDEAAVARQSEVDTALLRADIFAPAAAEQLGLVKTGCARALVAMRPDNVQAVRETFGALGMAEIGANLSTAISPLLEGDDLATRIGDVTILAFVSRGDENVLERWIEKVLETLSTRIFEGAGQSAHLDFVAGFAPVNRVRRLDALVRQAQEAMRNTAPGKVVRAAADTTTVEIDDANWEAFIREALNDHRDPIALLPIEDLATGSCSWEALPRLLDREGKAIHAESFQPPAERLGLLPMLEHRLLAHALQALLKRHDGSTASRIIVPLHATTLRDDRFSDFLRDSIANVRKPPPPESLVLEFDIAEAASRVRDAERFARNLRAFGFTLGLRGYAPRTMDVKLLETLPLASLRMPPEVTARLCDENDDSAASLVKAAVARMESRGVRLIATGVENPTTMAMLYNLGIAMVQGPMIGEAELFHPAPSSD
jgi:PAS domain S-box-containing protein